MDILYSDNRIVVCIKPAGIVSTDESGGVPDLVRKYFDDESACIRTVHRLDQVVGGVMVLARSREAARRLSRQIEAHEFHKEYLAIVEGVPEHASGCLEDFLIRDKKEKMTCIADTASKYSRKAILHYRVLTSHEMLSLIRIRLETGRTHQIRAQFSSRNLPIVGDRKYGSTTDLGHSIALWSRQLDFCHPQTEQAVSFSALPKKTFPWNQFPELWDGNIDWSTPV